MSVSERKFIYSGLLGVCPIFGTMCPAQFYVNCRQREKGELLSRAGSKFPRGTAERNNIVSDLGKLISDSCELGKKLGRNMKERELNWDDLIFLHPGPIN